MFRRKIEPDRDLIHRVSRRAIAQVAPDELVVFDDVSEQFFTGPARIRRKGGRDEALGAGIDQIVDFLTTVALTVTTGMIVAARDEAARAVRTSTAGGMQRLLRRRRPDPPQPTPRLTDEQAQRLRPVATKTAIELGVEPDRAAVLANAIIGELLTPQSTDDGS